MTDAPPRSAGRPATGRATQAVAFRLPNAIHAELLRRAARLGLTPAEFCEAILRQELAHRPGEGTRKRLGLTRQQKEGN